MVTLEALEQMYQEDKATARAKSLVDIRHINIDTNLPALERLEKYLLNIQNPYFFFMW
ncbi:DUF6870 family protein [Bacillus andreraoultii]|uniref:DUF6870 family protein n=1 Tax=Bacillus andreraoultii TaxID=1499685 RepID=UPI000A8DCABB|nr:hypothetical protein [Bacillus andreraoultii]